MDHMKVLITTDWYSPVVNGVVFSVVLLKRELERLGHEVRVVTLSGSHRSYREGNVYYLGSVSAARIYPGARLRPNRSRRVLRELAEWGPDVIHSQCEFSTFRVAHALHRRLGVPIVHTYHTVYEDYTHYVIPSRRMGRQVVSAFSRWVANRSACIIAPSGKVRALLAGYGVSCRLEVIPTGLDLDRFAGESDPAWREETLRRLDIPSDRPILLYLGRLAKEKELERVLEALADGGRRDFTFLVVGDGPYRQALEERAAALPFRTVFAGMAPHDRIRDYYQLGDLFLTASTSETQGLTYFEALAAGVPVLCRRDLCVQGVVEDGVNGWQWEDQADLMARLDQFLDDPALRRALAQGARQSAQRFSAQAFGRAVSDLYASLAGQPAAVGAD